jgi:hypothetical protein
VLRAIDSRSRLAPRTIEWFSRLRVRVRHQNRCSGMSGADVRSAKCRFMKVGNVASEIGGGAEPNNATSPMNGSLFGKHPVLYTFSG